MDRFVSEISFAVLRACIRASVSPCIQYPEGILRQGHSARNRERDRETDFDSRFSEKTRAAASVDRSFLYYAAARHNREFGCRALYDL